MVRTLGKKLQKFIINLSGLKARRSIYVFGSQLDERNVMVQSILAL